MGRASGFADLETPDEKRQRQASEHHQAQQVKTIHEGQHGLHLQRSASVTASGSSVLLLRS
jgi:hypothetical protein